MIKQSRAKNTRVGGVRLGLEHWAKLRSLMAYHGGRRWLEVLIDAAYRRIVKALKND